MPRVPGAGSLRASAALAALAPFLAACASDDGATESAPLPRVAESAPPADAGRVTIPATVIAELDAWSERDATLLAKVIEIDATRVPFAEGRIGIEASRETDEQGQRLVERTEETDQATRTVTVTLVNRSGMKTVPSLLPTVRLAGARTFIATDRLVLRYVPSPGADRPIVFSALATGNARLLEHEPERKVTGSVIRVAAEVLQGADGWRFRPLEDVRP